jgi:hypothetical protein
MSVRHNPARCRRAVLAGAVVLTALLGGCGAAGPYPVEGTVVWEDGSPAKELVNAIVIFDLPEKQTKAQGNVQADGTFRLTTTKPNDGALPGEYKVMIIEVGRRALGGPDATAIAPGHMDSKYSDPSSTDLIATVEARKDNKVTLKVKRAARR